MSGWSAEGVVVRRGRKTLLDGISLTLRPGGLTALLGPNGSGKTTLLKVLSGLLAPDSGTVHEGKTMHWNESDWAARVACAFGPATEEIPFCVEEVLLSSQFPDGGRWLDPSEERRVPLLEILERLEVFAEGARAGLDRAYATLSAGERQLVDVTRAVLQPSEVLLLDEPTSALDLRHRLLVTELLKDEARKGRTVVLSLHDLAEVDDTFLEVVVLHRGKLEAAGPPADVLNEKLLARVWGVAPATRGFRLL